MEEVMKESEALAKCAKSKQMEINFLDGRIAVLGGYGKVVYYQMSNGLLTILTPSTDEGGQLYTVSYPLTTIQEFKTFPVID
jgi:hypothetical protein